MKIKSRHDILNNIYLCTEHRQNQKQNRKMTKRKHIESFCAHIAPFYQKHLQKKIFLHIEHCDILHT